MRELVVIISDLYLAGCEADASRSSPAAASPALPGLEDAVRFGQRSALDGGGGWRAWLARSLGRDDLARAAPAAIAAAATAGEVTVPALATNAPAAATAPAATSTGATLATTSAASAGSVWIATPIHLLAGLTRLHLDYRSMLRLPAEDLTRLAGDFSATFGHSEFQLDPSASGTLLLQSRDTVDAVTTEPARALVRELEASLPSGRDGPVLKRLGAEMEMWLHGHPLNEARARRGEPPVSTLWLWGGGPLLPFKAPPTNPASPASFAAFGADPYLEGLCRLNGTALQPLPERLPDPTQSRDAQSVAIVAEITPLLHANPRWTMLDALADIDRRYIEPAMNALRRGSIDSVIVIANDTQVQVRRRDLLKFWRPRPKSGSAALLRLCW